jgi:hypothetical protein
MGEFTHMLRNPIKERDDRISALEAELGRLRDTPAPCSDCGGALELAVWQSAAGFYIGRWCNCGPYSRHSHYFATRGEAQVALDRLVGK